MNEPREKKARVRISGLWKNEAGTVISGNWGGCRIVIFPEREKKSPNGPDFTMYIEEGEPKPKGNGSDKGGW